MVEGRSKQVFETWLAGRPQALAGPDRPRHRHRRRRRAATRSQRAVLDRTRHSTVAAALRYQYVMNGRDATIAEALDRLLRAQSGTDVARDEDEPPDERKRHAG